ncbi:MAG: DUF4390 domain-containing protein [Acidobacteria bacterium]|nr:DUF4390 domain-containing protein [Acidobacteriota bacterium]
MRLPVWRNLFIVGLVMTSLVLTAVPASAETLRVRPLVRGSQVLVSFALEQGFTDQVREVVRSGLRTTFTYTVELKLKVPAWVDRTIGTAVVSTTVEFDNLTRRHTISRMLDGRMEESRMVEDEDIVRQLMTTFDRLPLFDTRILEQNREYYVVVRAEARPRSGAAFWPWGGATSGTAKFTFIP